METCEKFRQRLMAEMTDQALTPAGLSRRAGLNRRAVTDIIEGRARNPGLSTLCRLAAALGLGLDELVGLRPRVAPALAEIVGQYSEDDQARLAAAILAFRRAPGAASQMTPPLNENPATGG